MNGTSSPARLRVKEQDTLRLEILRGLGRRQKALPCKLFYDARGSELFERICELEEYYPTRTELGILEAHAEEMAGALGTGVTLIEFGSGASIKTRLLLDALEAPRAYVPIDISESALLASSMALSAAYPALTVRPVCADYTAPLDLPAVAHTPPVAAFFPGSTIGNFEPDAAVEFLRRVHDNVGQGGKLVIGVDLKKDPKVLEAAYDDREGVTAAFNLNMLGVLNRDHAAHFQLESFGHRAVWNERAGRIEMHLVSQRRQSVLVDTTLVRFEPGEHIVTEHCYKYDLDQFRNLAHASGFEVERVFTDSAQRFSEQLLVAR